MKESSFIDFEEASTKTYRSRSFSCSSLVLGRGASLVRSCGALATRGVGAGCGLPSLTAARDADCSSDISGNDDSTWCNKITS